VPAVPPLAVGFDEHITSLQGAIRGAWPRPRPTTCCIVASTLHSGGKRPHTNMLHAPGGGPPRLDQELLQFSSHFAVTGNDCATDATGTAMIAQMACCIVASTLHSGGKRPHTNRHQAVGAWVRDCGGWAGAWVRPRIFKQAQPEVALRCVSTIEVLVFSHVCDQ